MPLSVNGSAAIEPDPALNAFRDEDEQKETIMIPEMRAIQRSGAPNLVLDVRADRSFTDSESSAEGSIRIPPDRAVQQLKDLGVPRQTWLFAFCA